MSGGICPRGDFVQGDFVRGILSGGSFVLEPTPYTPPFYNTSCDYFCLYNVKIGRNKSTKHYGVIFTCLNTRAVHLELAVDYSTMEYIQLLRRFFAIRGYLHEMLSDNGSQLVGAEKELQLMIKGWNIQQLKDFCADGGMKWRFTTLQLLLLHIRMVVQKRW